MTRSLLRGTAAVVCLVTVLLATACDKNGNGPTPNPVPTTSSPSPKNSITPCCSPPTTQPPTPTASSSPSDNRPIVGDLVAAAQNVQCAYVPNGNIDGSDGLTVFMYIYLIGASSLPGPMHTAVSFSNGYSVTSTGFPNGSAYQPMQGPIRATDWGHVLTVRITTDPADEYRESVEDNNAISVAVNLPSPRPTHTVDPLSCT